MKAIHKKTLAIGAVILVVLLLVTPVAAKTFKTTSFATKSTNGVHQFMKNYGYGASSIQESLSYLPTIHSLDLAEPSEHSIPVPGAAFSQYSGNAGWDAYFGSPTSGGCGCGC